MKALVFAEPGQMVVKEVPLPEIAADEVLIEVKACGICRSDFDLLQGEYFLPLHWPIIPGHEYSGVVAEVGAQVTKFKKGDRVVGECAVEWESTCETNSVGNLICGTVGKDFGFTIDGAMAEYTKARESWLHKLPDNLSFTSGALVEPFTVGYYALSNIGGVDASDTVLILGAGVIGLSALIAAKGKGARTIVVDQQERRLSLARKLGTDEVVDTSKTDLLQGVLDLTEGRGADVTVEAVGADPLMRMLFDLTAQGGRVSITGLNFNDDLKVPLYKVQQKELLVKGNTGSRFVWPRVLKFLSQVQPDLDELRSHDFTLEDAVEAFRMADNPAQATKVHIIP
jgi:L-iditol 2-dehydrogenase